MPLAPAPLPALLLLLLLLAPGCVAQDEVGEEHHSRVGNPEYWTVECFEECYKVYLRCIGKVFPPKKLDNLQIIQLHHNKSNGLHEVFEACSAQYKNEINIEDDDRRNAAMRRLNETLPNGLKSNFDLCVFTQCGAGGYFGGFNVNALKYDQIKQIMKNPLDKQFEFYFEMNSV